MGDNRIRNLRRTARYPTDQFVPAVIAGGPARMPLGGHVVDVGMGGVRMVAAPNLVPTPAIGDEVELVFARSDGNRELDVDGVTVPCRVVDVREPPGGRVIRLAFATDAPKRIARWIRRLSREGSQADDDSLPEFDPDVWAGWAAISPA